MPDHTQAETWLRNAPAGVRSVTGEHHCLWQSTATQLLIVSCPGGSLRTAPSLPPGTYTLNYRVGLELDAEEAWDYLAGGEERRCVDKDGDYTRCHEGQMQFVLAGVDHPEWTNTSSRELFDRRAPYTIAPDEPSRSIWTTPASGGPIPEATIDHNVTPEQVATVADEPPCCREARERVAELEAEATEWSAWRDELDVDLGTADDEVTLDAAKRVSGERREALAKVADLEAKLAEAERCLSLTPEQARTMLYVAERALDDAIAERDKLRAEVKTATARGDAAQRSLILWHNAFRRTCMEERDSERHPNEWPAFMRQRFDKLRAEVESWRQVFLDEVALEDIAGDSASWPAYWRNHETRARAEMARLKVEVERLERELRSADLDRELSKANAERLDTWRGQSADIRGALELPHDAEWETVFQAVRGLRGEVTKLTKQRFDLCEAAGYYLDAEGHNRVVDDSCVEAALGGLAEAMRGHDSCIEESARLAEERDKLQRSLTLWQNAYRTHFAPQYDETRHPNEWPEVARVTVERLRAEVERLSAFEGDSQVLTEVVGFLGLDDEAVSEDVYAAISELQQAAITLPTDTTTPLDLAQRAVALMGEKPLLGRWEDGDVRFEPKVHKGRLLVTAVSVEGKRKDVRHSDWATLLSSAVITLAPDPEPERRKLTFAEAWKEAAAGKSVPRANVTVGPDVEVLEMVGEGGCVRFRFAEECGGGWLDWPPAGVADATWEAKS